MLSLCSTPPFLEGEKLCDGGGVFHVIAVKSTLQLVFPASVSSIFYMLVHQRHVEWVTHTHTCGGHITCET